MKARPTVMWNVVCGCSKSSLACMNCTAEMEMARCYTKEMREEVLDMEDRRPKWNGKSIFIESEYDIPAQHRGAMIYVALLGDLFSNGVKREWIDRVFAKMLCNPQNNYQILTRKVARLHDYLSDSGLHDRLTAEMAKHDHIYHDAKLNLHFPGIIFCTSIEDQASADARLPVLADCDVLHRGVYAEPLIDFVTLTDYLIELDWVLIGADHSRNPMPCEIEWMIDMANECRSFQVPFMVNYVQPKDNASPITRSRLQLPEELKGASYHRLFYTNP